MKNIKEYLVELVEGETPAFVRVFEALPEDKLDWKPDEKSKTAGQLASMIAEEIGHIATILEKGDLPYDPTATKQFASTKEMVDTFKAGAEAVKTQLGVISDENWEAEANMMMNGQSMWKSKRGEMAWAFMLDLIHHRGQLSTYIRPMGGKVPSIYGPSADTQGN